MKVPLHQLKDSTDILLAAILQDLEPAEQTSKVEKMIRFIGKQLDEHGITVSIIPKDKAQRELMDEQIRRLLCQLKNTVENGLAHIQYANEFDRRRGLIMELGQKAWMLWILFPELTFFPSSRALTAQYLANLWATTPDDQEAAKILAELCDATMTGWKLPMDVVTKVFRQAEDLASIPRLEHGLKKVALQIETYAKADLTNHNRNAPVFPLFESLALGLTKKKAGANMRTFMALTRGLTQAPTE